MLGSHGFHRILTKFSYFSSIYDSHLFGYYKSSIKSVHSLHQSRVRGPIRRFGQNGRKPSKPTRNQNVEPKFYMRDTVLNIYRILKYSTWDSAQDQLQQLPIKWDSYTVNQVLKTHPPMQKAWLFFNWASELNGFKHDQFTYTTMLDIFGEAGKISSMYFVFRQMQQTGITIDTVTYTSLLHWVSNSGDVDGAVKLWEGMIANGCCPTVVSYTAYMKVLFDNGRVKEATGVYKQMLLSGISPNCHTYTVLMDHLVGAGRCEEAFEIFLKMQEAGVKPDKAACNILVEKCCKVGEKKTMTKILLYMKENGVVLRYPVFLEALKTLKAAGESDTLLREVNPHVSVECTSDEEADECMDGAADVPLGLDRGLLLILLKKQNLFAVDRLLAGIMGMNVKLDSMIISTIVDMNCDCCRPDGALLAFEYSVQMGLDLERSAYLSMIGILIRSQRFHKVVEIVKEMIKAGHVLGGCQGALLIYRLGCARRPLCAAEIFDCLPDNQKGTAIYTALINVYFSTGNADKGLEIYKNMRRKGIHPSLGTYKVLLAGLEKCGKFSEAKSFRKEKKALQTDDNFQHVVPVEERICDILFAGNMLLSS